LKNNWLVVTNPVPVLVGTNYIYTFNPTNPSGSSVSTIIERRIFCWCPNKNMISFSPMKNLRLLVITATLFAVALSASARPSSPAWT